MKRIVSLVVIFSCLVVGAYAQITKDGAGYRIKAKFTKGQTLKYDMSIQTKGKDVPANAAKMSMPFSLTVKEVNKGIATVQYKGEMMGQKLDQTIKINEFGKVVQGNSVSGVSAHFPNRVLKPGDSWKMDIPVNSPMAAGMKMNGTYKFVGIKRVNGRELAEIAVDMKGSGGTGGMTLTGKGTMFYLVSDGQLWSASINQNMGAQNMNLKMVVSIKRL